MAHMTKVPPYHDFVFANPPIVEMVFSVQFTQLNSVQFSTWINYWHSIRETYPNIEIFPPIPDFTPAPLDTDGIAGLHLGELRGDDLRLWLMTADKSELLQVQRSRFVRNWRKISLDGKYPKYDALKPQFEESWKGFVKFLASNQQTLPHPNQYEITYVNQIDLQDSQPYRNYDKLFTWWVGQKMSQTLNPSHISSSIVFDFLEDSCRVAINIKPAIRKADLKQIIVMELIGRGIDSNPNQDSMMQWFDRAHVNIRKCFFELTTPEAQTSWGRKNDC